MVMIRLRACRTSGVVLRTWAGTLLVVTSLHAATSRDYRDQVGVYVWGKLAGGLESATATSSVSELTA
jgi:hypothetical protein